MSGLVLNHISKTFKNEEQSTLQDINITVGPEEFLVLLGPSGCGKSTLLRIISGLTAPTEGEILLDGEDITQIEPKDRHIGMVFQNYALFPHMTAEKNMSFPLEVDGVKRKKRHEIIDGVSSYLGISAYLKKKPDMLSGGERQRVAMGRAMVKDSRLYLFDESLSNLDENLRTRLRPEILKQFHELKVPFVYVTHDQTDAMTMATKVAVMNKGRIEQLGKPQEIYNEPANLFVAGFIGSPSMNFISMRVEKAGESDEIVLKKAGLSIPVPEYNSSLVPYLGKEVTVGIRPEDILTHKENEAFFPVNCLLERFEHLGNKIILFTGMEEEKLCLEAPITVRAKVGQELTVYLDREKLHLFDKESGVRIAK